MAECVLIYMTPEHSSCLLRWASSTFLAAMFINYEQVRGGEALCSVCEMGGVEALRELC